MSTIAIIGCGRLGIHLAEGLIRSGVYTKVLLWNRSRRRLDGVLESLAVFASAERSTVTVGVLSRLMLPHVDVVVVAIKDSYDPRDLLKDEKYPSWFAVDVRTVGFSRDLPLMRSVAHLLDGYTGTVVIISNPVDVFTTLVKQWLPAATIIGLGVSLDAARLVHCLTPRARAISWLDVPLAGEHGKSLIPLISLWKIRLAPGELQKALASSIQIGPRIVSRLGYTLHDCAVVFGADLIRLAQPRAHTSLLFASIGDAEGAIGRPISIPRQRAAGLTIFERLSTAENVAIKKAQTKVAEFVDRVRRERRFRDDL